MKSSFYSLTHISSKISEHLYNYYIVIYTRIRIFIQVFSFGANI